MKITHVALTLRELDVMLTNYLQEKLGPDGAKDVEYVRIESHQQLVLEIENFNTTSAAVVFNGDVRHKVF